MTLSERLRLQSPQRIFVVGLMMVAVLGAIDLKTPFELTLFMFYTAPILFVCWYGRRRDAMILAVVCTAVWYLANLNQPYFKPSNFAWAGFNRLVLLTIVAAGGAAMATQRDSMRSKLKAMERARELEDEILRIGEREKIRIGQELHDGLCQHLAAIDCAVACLKLDLEESSPKDAEAAAFIQKQLNKSIVEARQLALGIFPVQMNEEGFIAALEELVNTTNRLRQLAVKLRVRGEIKIREPQVGMHLYRIAQEALSNAAKHADAKQVQVDVMREGTLLTMSIIDDGKGLPLNGHTPKGLGLQTMNYRARSMGAALDIKNAPAGGTMVRCAVQTAS